MRIPIDLIAALLFIDRLATLADDGLYPTALTMALLWAGFLAGSWLLHELAARLTERRTRYGLLPDGGGSGMHPQQFHGRCVWFAQLGSVLLFALVAWKTKWPGFTAHWPTWFRLSDDARLGNLTLSRSALVSLVLTISPYLAAMVLSWIPRRRLASGARRHTLALWPYLLFEAKLTWLPLSLLLIMAGLSDGIVLLPRVATAWLGNEYVQLAVMLLVGASAVAVFMPLAAVKLWQCTPMPEGELKERLRGLLKRSGVQARAILVWGSRGSGLLNACVMGPWSRFRFVLISPLLADELSLDETEAVLGHELGHARYGHLSFYLVLMFCLSLAMAPLNAVLEREFKLLPLLQTGVTMAFLIGFIYFLFGPLSRQCEREADLASAEFLGTPQPLITALEKIALRAGNIRRVPCWHHGSIAERVNAVLNLSTDASASGQFHARLKRLRWTLVLVAALLLAAQCYFHLDG